MNTTTANTPLPSTPSHGHGREGGLWNVNPVLEVADHDRSGQQCVKSRQAFAAGQSLVFLGASAVHAHPSRLTVQVSEHEHIELAPAALSFLNHSCAPNVHLDVERGVIVALRPIAVGDELEFFYPSTEWVMASPFDCHCRSAGCIGRVTGASEVPASALAGRLLAPHIARLLAWTNR